MEIALIIFLILFGVAAIVLLVLFLRATSTIKLLRLIRKNEAAIDTTEESARKNRISSLESRIGELDGLIKEKEQDYQTKTLKLKELEETYNAKVQEWTTLYDNKTLELTAAGDKLKEILETREKLTAELNNLQQSIEAEKPHLSELSRELERLKELKRLALLESYDDSKDSLWELSINEKEQELISILNRIKIDYPDIKTDISTIEWRKIWLPKLQELGNREGLSCKGIYRLILKSDEKICYVGQAVSIQDRWYQHVKKMIGVDAKGNEKLYNYRPEDFYWTVLEKGPHVNLDESEKYWISYYCCKEIGLNKKSH